MDALLSALGMDKVAVGFSNLSMFPLFDMAHYIISVMALREQPGAIEISRRSPIACWFSAMIYCFGGAIVSSVLLGEPPVEVFSNNINILMASAAWYLLFYCPNDMFFNICAIHLFRVLLAGMKEVTRTWKVLSGVTLAYKQYKRLCIALITIGWAKGAGTGLMSNFEQLVRGVWKPETNELLKMSYATKVTLLGAVLFSLQTTGYLPIAQHNLMFMYTIFLVVTKVTMMMTGSTVSPFACVESVLCRVILGLKSGDAEEKNSKSATKDISNGTCPASNGNIKAEPEETCAPSASSPDTEESNDSNKSSNKKDD
ncbi:trimeric intracellular cation channel type B [Protopterus annectens]|uniref:trimeric intracellular cation channel type B n=1 Tax=Protopterus annectens TaxID=7888 RepID=UPI001CFAC7FB|nr:trimeric intracellular cation channel type B [Protopterus annectens]